MKFSEHNPESGDLAANQLLGKQVRDLTARREEQLAASKTPAPVRARAAASLKPHPPLREGQQRVGPFFVETALHREVLAHLKPSIGAAFELVKPIEELLSEIAFKITEAEKRLAMHNTDAVALQAFADLRRLGSSPIRRPSDLRYIVLQRLARALNASDSAIFGHVFQASADTLAQSLDTVLGLAMTAIAVERARWESGPSAA